MAKRNRPYLAMLSVASAVSFEISYAFCPINTLNTERAPARPIWSTPSQSCAVDDEGHHPKPLDRRSSALPAYFRGSAQNFMTIECEGQFLGLSQSRRHLLTLSALVLPVASNIGSTEAVAEDLVVDLDDDAMEESLTTIRKELNDPQGGIAYIEDCIQKEDFVSLAEFTKTYDLVLRKQYMGKAKKLLAAAAATTANSAGANIKDNATLYSNAVTFDLIGINRNSRPGRENATEAAKYLQELRQDVQKFLDLMAASQKG